MSKDKLCLEHRTPALGDGGASFPWTAQASFGVKQRETEPQVPAVPAELRVPQALPSPLALDLHQTAHVGKAMGVGAAVRPSFQEMLLRQLGSIPAGV